MSNKTTLHYNCPRGGKFYTCTDEATPFVGCCLINPCAAKGICPDSDLRAASFSQDDYSKIPTLDCNSDNQNGKWYTCAYTTFPFMGCCTKNPCSSTSEDPCEQEDLVAANLPSSGSRRHQFLKPPDSSTSETANVDSGTSSDHGGLSTGAIAGIAVGCTVAGLIILGLLIWRFCLVSRKKKEQQQQQQSIQPYSSPPMSQPISQGPYTPQTPMENYQASFVPNPAVTQYLNSTPNMYGKYPPQTGYDRPQSMVTTSDVSAVSPIPYNQVPSPVPMNPVHEIDTMNIPHEMSTGQEEHISFDRK